jgi:hypothetical protein
MWPVAYYEVRDVAGNLIVTTTAPTYISNTVAKANTVIQIGSVDIIGASSAPWATGTSAYNVPAQLTVSSANVLDYTQYSWNALTGTSWPIVAYEVLNGATIIDTITANFYRVYATSAASANLSFRARDSAGGVGIVDTEPVTFTGPATLAVEVSIVNGDAVFTWNAPVVGTYGWFAGRYHQG